MGVVDASCLSVLRMQNYFMWTSHIHVVSGQAAYMSLLWLFKRCLDLLMYIERAVCNCHMYMEL